VIAGLDEAGRGAVIGPLVVAGVSIMERDLPRLERLGLKDSKLLSPRRREALEKEIEKVARDILVLKIGACKIDTYRRQGINLNRLEAMKFAEIIDYLGPGKVLVDSPDVNTKRMGLYLKKLAKGDGIEMVAEHRADQNYPIVSAASIMAKVERDREIEEIKREYGDVGPGYSSNPITIKWLEDCLREKGRFPDIVRRTWMTAQIMEGVSRQSVLGKFFKGFRK
jgi:ribonuclease HII